MLTAEEINAHETGHRRVGQGVGGAGPHSGVSAPHSGASVPPGAFVMLGKQRSEEAATEPALQLGLMPKWVLAGRERCCWPREQH